MSESNKASTLSKFNLFAIIVMAVVLIIHEEEQSLFTEYLYEQLESGGIGKGNVVDFSASELQPITSSFLLAGASQKKHLTGVIFTGRIINATALKRTNVEFDITANPHSYASVSKRFTINQISSGNSTGFSVYIPELNLEDARLAKIEYINASTHFRIK